MEAGPASIDLKKRLIGPPSVDTQRRNAQPPSTGA